MISITDVGSKPVHFLQNERMKAILQLSFKDADIIVYTVRNQILFTVRGTLAGYTGNTVTVKLDGWIYAYDARKQINGTQSAI